MRVDRRMGGGPILRPYLVAYYDVLFPYLVVGFVLTRAGIVNLKRLKFRVVARNLSAYRLDYLVVCGWMAHVCTTSRLK